MGNNIINIYQHVLVVEDIIDTGKTMKKLLQILEKHNPKSVSVARYAKKS